MTEVAERIHRRIGAFLLENGQPFDLVDDVYVVPQGSTAANIDIVDFCNPDFFAQVVIRVTAAVLVDVEPQPALFEWIATEGQVTPFVRFRYDRDTHVLLAETAILGDYLDYEELTVSVGYVTTVADGMDEQLRDQFGGHTISDVAQG